MKIVNKFQLKIVIFTAVKNRCILNGRVFVMFTVRNMKEIPVFVQSSELSNRT